MPSAKSFRLLGGVSPIYVGLVSLAMQNRSLAQASADPGQFALKLSGFENLVGGSASTGRGGGVEGSSESEIEITPQYKGLGGTVFAIRGAFKSELARVAPHQPPL